MIKQDLLGISVYDLIKNYSILYNHITNEAIGIVMQQDVKKFQNHYGNHYIVHYEFLDIFNSYDDIIIKGKVLSYSELCKILSEYTFNHMIDDIAEIEHKKWVADSSKSTAMMLQLMKIINKSATFVDEEDQKVIKNIQNCIDKWKKEWKDFEHLDNTIQYPYRVHAREILDMVKNDRECE